MVEILPLTLSPIQYLNRYRIEKAKLVLLSSDHPVPEVARMVGISNSFKLWHLFQKHTGTSPSQFRKTEAKKKAD